MNSNIDKKSGKNNPWPRIVRFAWIAIVLVIMILFVVGLLISLAELRTVCAGGDCHPNQLDPAQAALNRQLGLSLNFYAWYTTITFALFGFVFFAIAWLIFWRRSDDWMALFVSLWMVIFGAGANAVIPAIGPVIFAFAGAGLVPLLFLFPDGRFVPRWSRWLVAAWLVYSIINTVISPPPAQAISSGPPSPVTQAAFLAAIASQIYRYRRVSTPVQRQQTKWVVSGFVGWFACLVALLLALAIFPALSQPGLPEFFLDSYIFAFVGLLPLLFLPLGIGISILRYRLWDIDVIIRRTLVYGALTAILVALYFALVLGIQAVVTPIVGGQSTLAIVISTLVIAALFNPLRWRIQNLIDRRFYRRRYDAEETLAGFSLTVRDQVDLENLSLALLSVVDDTMQPESVSVWLRETPRPQPPSPSWERGKGAGGLGVRG